MWVVFEYSALLFATNFEEDVGPPWRLGRDFRSKPKLVTRKITINNVLNTSPSAKKKRKKEKRMFFFFCQITTMQECFKHILDLVLVSYVGSPNPWLGFSSCRTKLMSLDVDISELPVMWISAGVYIRVTHLVMVMWPKLECGVWIRHTPQEVYVLC